MDNNNPPPPQSGRYETSQNVAESKRALLALGSSTDPSLIEETLEYSVSAAVRIQDTSSLLRRVASQSVAGRLLLWNFVRENWDRLMGRFADGNNQFKGLLQYMVQTALSREDLTAMRAFLDQRYPYAKSSVAIAYESAQHRLTWVAENRQAVSQWLKAAQQEQAAPLRSRSLPLQQ